MSSITIPVARQEIYLLTILDIYIIVMAALPDPYRYLVAWPQNKQQILLTPPP